MILGEDIIDCESDDFLYTKDLGLIRVNSDSLIIPSNLIYAEVIVRKLSSIVQEELQKPEISVSDATIPERWTYRCRLSDARFPTVLTCKRRYLGREI